MNNCQTQLRLPTPVGRILFIGVSYYNNEYLAASLRDLGWEAQVLFSCQEAASSFVHDQDKQVMQQCFEPVPKQFPQLFQSLAPILKIVGKSRPAEYPAHPKHWHFWRQIAVFAPEYLEQMLDEDTTSPKPLSLQLKELAGACRAWLALDPAQRHDPPALLAPLTTPEGRELLRTVFRFFLQALRPDHPELAHLNRLVDGHYDIVHFTGVHSMRFFYYYSIYTYGFETIGWDIDILKRLGIKVVYSNVACFDGVKASTFSKLTPEVCSLCNWHGSEYCNDARNTQWGDMRNRLADYQITLGGNRNDLNQHPDVHEVPGFYCLDKDKWSPDRTAPATNVAAPKEARQIVLYHAVGNFEMRSSGIKNIKCTHVYVPLVQQMQDEGYAVRLDIVSNVPNQEIIWRQLQADIFCDQLTFGWFGANAREGMMLGKPVICYLRPEWLASVAREIPEYVAELPIVSATPDTVASVLKYLVQHPEKRQEIGHKGRVFATKWHDRSSGARQVAAIYQRLISSRQHELHATGHR